ncbi:hypothetical protein ACFFRR_001138 [Megaselia abdita]
MQKAVPYTVMAVATGWQEYENYKTRQEVQAVEEKRHKVSFLLLNISETETSHLQQQLDNLVQQHQQQIILESETNGFAASTQSLISTVEGRHQGITDLRPTKELKSYVNTLNNHSQIVRIPLLTKPDDVFTIDPIQKYVVKDLVILKYDIPLSRPEKYTKYGYQFT